MHRNRHARNAAFRRSLQLTIPELGPRVNNISHYRRAVDLLRPRASSPELGLKLEVAPQSDSLRHHLLNP